MDSIRDLMQNKANDLDVDAKRDELSLAQKIVTRQCGEGAKVNKIKDNRLFIDVNSAPMASEIRLKSQSLIQAINSGLNINLEQIKTKVIQF